MFANGRGRINHAGEISLGAAGLDCLRTEDKKIMACHHNMPFALHTKNGQPLCAARSPINHIIMVEIPCKIPAFTGSLLPTRARPQPTDNPGKYKTPRRYAASPRPAERLKKPSAHKKNSPARAPGVPYLQYSMQSSGGLAPGKVSPGEAWRDRPLLKRRVSPRSFPAASISHRGRAAAGEGLAGGGPRGTGLSERLHRVGRAGQIRSRFFVRRASRQRQ